MTATPFAPLTAEAETYFRALPRLLNAGEAGRCVLIKDNAIVGVWDSDEEAYAAGLDRFGLGVPFLAQPIDAADLSRFAPYFPAMPQSLPA
jgi:hypothetical protein